MAAHSRLRIYLLALHLLPMQWYLSIFVAEAANLQVASFWTQTLEDLNEYSLLRVGWRRSAMECLYEGAAADAAEFSESERSCRLYSCKWGGTGCRKCRNNMEPGGQLVWVRRLLVNGRPACWRTFQHRVDGSVLFNRSWAEYQSGFGQDERRNFWLGLDTIHQATKDGQRRVRWELSLWTGDRYWAENEHFIVAGSDQLYRLDLGALDETRSTLGMVELSNARSPHNKSFSTFDSDNDLADKNCADNYQAGWWHGNCFLFNPNGRYIDFEATESGQTGGPAMCYTWPGSSHPFVLWYSHRTFECLFTEFL